MIIEYILLLFFLLTVLKIIFDLIFIIGEINRLSNDQKKTDIDLIKFINTVYLKNKK